jgi:hypothetical protein
VSQKTRINVERKRAKEAIVESNARIITKTYLSKQ